MFKYIYKIFSVFNVSRHSRISPLTNKQKPKLYNTEDQTMKDNTFRAAMVLEVILAGFSACKKEQAEQRIDNYELTSVGLADETLADMMNDRPH